MPFKSKSQQRKFFADPELRQYAHEFAEHTDFKHLPERVKTKERHTEKLAGLSPFARTYLETYLDALA